jgi:protein-tyrosine phosphatase
MAEFVLKDMLKKEGINGVHVSSCATSNEEIWNGIGNPIYPPAKAELKKHGITCDGKTAVQLKKSDYENYDIFYCMDEKNVRNSLKIFGSDPKGKVKKLLGSKDVADPWYSDRFDIAYSDIYLGCTKIIETIQKNGAL